jgi:nucleotide-binding universal stress UspA family protein
MDTILIATDFTAAAHNAMVYGAQLARDLRAHILLVNIVQPVMYSADVVNLVSNDELHAESISLLEFEAASINHFGVPIDIRCAEGSASDEIISIARQTKASWIVVGMKAKDKLFRKIFGSNAVTISRLSSIPLIVVPEHAAYLQPSSIALANDVDDDVSIHTLNPLQELAQRFQSYLFILKVVDKHNHEAVQRVYNASSIKWHMKALYTSEELLDDTDVAHAINEFVEDHDVDMVAMVAREHNLLQRIFTRNHIKEMMFEVHVPLVILPGQPNYNHELAHAKSFLGRNSTNGLQAVRS